MLLSEFIERTGYQPSAQEYSDIEKAYYDFSGDKDKFCRAWCKANPHKAGKLFAAVKEQERQRKVFDNVCEFVRKCKRKREEFYAMSCADINEFLDEMAAKCKCNSRRELRDMVYSLSKAVAVWQGWKYDSRDLLIQLEYIV